ncbi:uncharacterized protein RCC_10823 [Ramularia collo-cygni]|uniref:Uncharacterized protein n=1 Tax=Ramularia collo-cygni TaxID=112498 RepID=A0A2D3VPN6_9PEZI|nr:uncharacterized protein RCC_10823 [Ramularia collo-cygni]CZT25094.1 uncharacterized protein RCC_10823 [Ramularia collo-cygni]
MAVLRSDHPSSTLRKAHIAVPFMTFSDFVGFTTQTFRRIYDAFERRVSVAEMMESAPQSTPNISPRSPRPYAAARRNSNEGFSIGPQVSSNTIPICYDKEFVPSGLRDPQRYRRELRSSVSEFTDVTDTHFDIPSRPTFPAHRVDNGEVLETSPTDILRLHPLLPDGFQSPGGSTNISSSPVTRHHLFAPEATPNIESSSTYQGSLSNNLHQKSSHHDLFADHLESAWRNLEAAQQELQHTRESLADKEHDVHNLNIQVSNLQRGLDTALHQHNAMARELSDLKAYHTTHKPLKRCSLLTNLFFHSSSSKSKIHHLENRLHRAQTDIQILHDRWRSTHHSLTRTEDVLEEQRECMKVRIIALKHTQMELGAVRGKLQTAERMLEDRKAVLEVLRQSNRDLALEIAYLKRRGAGRTGVF